MLTFKPCYSVEALSQKIDSQSLCQIYNQMDDMALAETSGRSGFLIHKHLAEEITEESDIYEISGNSYTIIEHHKRIYDGKQYKYLKINIIGSCNKSFSYGCFYFLIATVILFFFPVFLFCCDCCKRKLYNLFNVKHEAYEAVSQILAQARPSHFYLVIQDNFFNEAKCNAIGRGLEQSHTEYFQMVNTSKGINTYGHNYSDFAVYAKQLKQFVVKAKCRWESFSV